MGSTPSSITTGIKMGTSTISTLMVSRNNPKKISKAITSSMKTKGDSVKVVMAATRRSGTPSKASTQLRKVAAEIKMQMVAVRVQTDKKISNRSRIRISP